MMITQNNLPSAYRPFSKLTVCSNILIGGGVFLIVGDVVPILIGRGTQPKIWMQIPSGSEPRFTLVVEESISLHESLTVLRKNGLLTIGYKGEKLLVVKGGENDSDEVTVIRLDLRKVGYAIHGNEKKLYLGGSVLIGNISEGGRAMFVTN